MNIKIKIKRTCLDNFRINIFSGSTVLTSNIPKDDHERSARELSNAYLLAQFGFDTAENEPFKVR